MTFLESLNWRFAARKLTGAKLPEQNFNNILEAIRLAPSAYGLQPYKLVVVQDQETLKRITPAINNQPQVAASSALLIFATLTQIDEKAVNDYIQNIAQTRNIPEEGLVGLKNAILGTVNSLSVEQLSTWAAKQAYIGLGVGISAAATEQVDSSPMEGFKPDELDKELGLAELGLKSTVLLALGRRDETDPFIAFKKVRKSAKDFFVHI